MQHDLKQPWVDLEMKICVCVCVLMGGGLGKKLGLDWFVFLLHTNVARLK